MIAIVSRPSASVLVPPHARRRKNRRSTHWSPLRLLLQGLPGICAFPRSGGRVRPSRRQDQVLKLSLVWKHVEHMITFLFDMMGDLFPLVLWNKKCVDCYLVSPSRPR